MITVLNSWADEASSHYGLVEEALLHHLQALRELPADILIPPRLTVTGKSFRAIYDLVEGSSRPTTAMRDLMAGRPVDGAP